ncbi:hypothetical protein BHE74_00017471 [Ensete ventricosum]|nr:hypothetical protein GW17_00000322 [Ensete ventricosum]RWW74589.1 hypothetical protein BHE74_00017471 [Ensete ventricosum]
MYKAASLGLCLRFRSLPSIPHLRSPPSSSRSLAFSRSSCSFLPRPRARLSTGWGPDWRSRIGPRARIRSSSTVIQRFDRKMATTGTYNLNLVVSSLTGSVFGSGSYASLYLYAATENVFKDVLTSLPKPGGGEYGKYYSLPALDDPRIGN